VVHFKNNLGAMGHSDWPITKTKFETLGMFCSLAPMLKTFEQTFSFLKNISRNLHLFTQWVSVNHLQLLLHGFT